MKPSNDTVAFHALAAKLNSKFHEISDRIGAYEDMAPWGITSTSGPDIDEFPQLPLDDMSGEQFEDWCCQLLRKQGYDEVETTRATGDFGADIIAVKDGIRFAIQCKRYSDPVGLKAVQEAHSAKEYYDCDIAAVATSSTFTASAVELAAKNRVKLWDRTQLEQWTELSQDPS